MTSWRIVGTLGLGLAWLCSCGGQDDEVAAAEKPSADSSAACEIGDRLLDDGSCQPAGLAPDGCGEGFAHDGAQGCEPILPPDTCLRGQMATVGDTQCHPVAPCGSTTWGDIPVDASTQYVDAAYGGQSDGSAQRPWLTIGEGIAAVAAGGLVAVAAGSYPEDVVLGGKAARVWGRCPELSEVVGTGAGLAALVVQAGASGSELHNLAVSGSAAGVRVEAAQKVLLEGLWIHDTALRGVVVDSKLGPSGATLRGSLIESVSDMGVIVFGAEMTIEGSAIRFTKSVGGEFGRGVNAEPRNGEPSDVTIRSSVIENNREMAVRSVSSHITIEDSVLRHTLSATAGAFGRAIELNADSAARTRLTIRRSLISDAPEAGLFILGPVDTLIENTVVRDLPGTLSGIGGRGIAMEARPWGAPSLVLRSSLITGVRDVAVYLSGVDAQVEATAVRDVTTSVDRDDARGFQVARRVGEGTPAALTIHDSSVERIAGVAFQVSGAELSVGNTVVRDISPNEAGEWGRGYNAQDSEGARALVTLERVLVQRCHDIGIFAESSELSIDGLIIEEMRSHAASLTRGRGIVVQGTDGRMGGAVLDLKASTISGAREFGVLLFGATATISQTQIEGTLAQEAEALYGDGVAVVGLGSQLVVRGVGVRDSARAGIASFGQPVTLSASVLVCNAFHLNGEPQAGIAASFTDAGDNQCSCGAKSEPCRVLSSSLTPPTVVE